MIAPSFSEAYDPNFRWRRVCTSSHLDPPIKKIAVAAVPHGNRHRGIAVRIVSPDRKRFYRDRRDASPDKKSQVLLRFLVVSRIAGVESIPV